jgi:hypothetical protein
MKPAPYPAIEGETAGVRPATSHDADARALGEPIRGRIGGLMTRGRRGDSLEREVGAPAIFFTVFAPKGGYGRGKSDVASAS